MVIEITQEEEKTSRKYAKRRDRRQAIISMLDSLSNQYHQENLERSMIYFKNPFELAVDRNNKFVRYRELRG